MLKKKLICFFAVCLLFFTSCSSENKASEHTCSISIECSTVFNNIDLADEAVLELLPNDGVIFIQSEVEFSEGESVFDLLQRVCKENGIHMESSVTPAYGSAYIEGIANLYEFDFGSLSGWMYCVNEEFPHYGCSSYLLNDGDVVEWKYTCDLGSDIGGNNAAGE